MPVSCVLMFCILMRFHTLQSLSAKSWGLLCESVVPLNFSGSSQKEMQCLCLLRIDTVQYSDNSTILYRQEYRVDMVFFHGQNTGSYYQQSSDVFSYGTELLSVCICLDL